MILPSKHLSYDRSLVVIGSDILRLLDQPRHVSDIWERLRRDRASRPQDSPLSFDWFILGLSFLYAILAIDLLDGLVVPAGELRS